jgi:hypothetical protein
LIEALEAAALLLSRVAPQERAAVVLKEVFDFTLEQIAEILSTTVGAVKSALHRERVRLEEVPSMPRAPRWRTRKTDESLPSVIRERGKGSGACGGRILPRRGGCW